MGALSWILVRTSHIVVAVTIGMLAPAVVIALAAAVAYAFDFLPLEVNPESDISEGFAQVALGIVIFAAFAGLFAIRWLERIERARRMSRAPEVPG
jgi:hypothetical protein